jgi:HPr kinase/phosphorylase
MAKISASQVAAESTSLHGVFMEVQGLGVLIKGAPAIGKSELALELISRGHRLVADDIVNFSLVEHGHLAGDCPELLQDFLEVRGLGILNIRELYGDNAIQTSKQLDLIIQLEMAEKLAPQLLDRLSIKSQEEEILRVKIPRLTVLVAAGRNLAVLVEAALRNHLLLLRGVNATEQLIQRQNHAMKKSG